MLSWPSSSKCVFAGCLSLLAGVPTLSNAQTPSSGASGQNTEAKISALLARMTLPEKFGQLEQVQGTWDGGVRPEQIPLAREGMLGSVIFVRGAAHVDALQRVAMTESRLKIPILFGFDVIHGYRTIFPVPLAEAASWDPSVAREADGIAAAEASAAGIRWTFAPMVDIARDPRWGRIVEGSGEDPCYGEIVKCWGRFYFVLSFFIKSCLCLFRVLVFQ